MATPSLVMTGAPHFFSRITFCPLGPRVRLTALAIALIPFNKAFWASSSRIICFAGILLKPPTVWRTLAGPYFLVVYIEGRPTISQCYVITFTNQNHKSGGPTGQDTA